MCVCVCVCMCVCVLEPSKMRRPKLQSVSCPTENKNLFLKLPVFWIRRCADLCIDAAVSEELADLVSKNVATSCSTYSSLLRSHTLSMMQV